MHKRLVLITVLAIASLSLYACGDDSDDSTDATDHEAARHATTASQEDREAIEMTLHSYFGATTSQDVCDNITLGFQAFLDNQSEPSGDPAAPADEGCEEVIEMAVKDGHFVFGESDIDIQLVLVEGQRAGVSLVNSSVSQNTYPVFLVAGASGWLITAENFVPPGFEEAFSEVHQN